MSSRQERSASSAPARAELRDGTLTCSGAWTSIGLGQLDRKIEKMRWPGGGIVMDGSGITAMDLSGAWLLRRTLDALEEGGREVQQLGLAGKSRSLLGLAASYRDAARFHPQPVEENWLESIGRDAMARLREYVVFLSFIGHITFTSLRILLTPARMRWHQVAQNLQEGGFDALPIVGLLSFLMGIVIAYQGGALLQDYGATIFIADLVGLSMLRELSPLLTAIIIAGRTGSSFTAQIATMKVTEEVDALRTMGITPVEMLVLPKMFALVLAMPLLTVFADIMGVAGGMFMSSVILEVSPKSFIDRLSQAVGVESYLIGIGKAPVFAAIIASVGCYQGFQADNNAESVGRQTTLSVVQSIFLVIVVDAVFSVIFNKLGL